MGGGALNDSPFERSNDNLRDFGLSHDPNGPHPSPGPASGKGSERTAHVVSRASVMWG